MRQVTRKGLITVAAAGGVLALGGGYAHADSGAAGTAANSPGVLSGNNVQVPVDVPVNVCGNSVNVVGLLNPAFGNSCANVSGGSSGHGGGSRGHGGSDDDGGYGGGGSHGGGSHNGGSHGGSHNGGPRDGGTHHKPPQGGSHGGGSHGGSHGGGSHAGGDAGSSPGVGSGNGLQLPIDIPVNVCGLGIDVIGLGNPVTGDNCENDAPPVVTPPERPVTPGTPHPHPVTHRDIPPAPSHNTPVAQTVAKPLAGPEELAHTGAGSVGMAASAGVGMLLAGSILYRRARAAA